MALQLNTKSPAGRVHLAAGVTGEVDHLRMPREHARGTRADRGREPDRSPRTPPVPGRASSSSMRMFDIRGSGAERNDSARSDPVNRVPEDSADQAFGQRVLEAATIHDHRPLARQAGRRIRLPRMIAGDRLVHDRHVGTPRRRGRRGTARRSRGSMSEIRRPPLRARTPRARDPWPARSRSRGGNEPEG